MMMEHDSIINEEKDERRKREQRHKKFVLRMSLFALLVLACIAVFATWLAGGFGKADDEDTTKAQQPDNSTNNNNPTMAPTANLFPLPEYTLEAIREDPESPQAKAYDWVQADPSLTLFDSTRLQQRFVLSTFYYATAGPEWTLQEGWLDYDSHECNWYSKGTTQAGSQVVVTAT